MSVPRGPEDIELRNIIDKLAQFVAKNGPEFEQMTKAKQQDNARFGFLFGGEYYDYYQFRVTTEQAIARQQQSRQSAGAGPLAGMGQASQVPQGGSAGAGPPAQDEATAKIQQQIQALQQQLSDSEKNLQAQKQVIMQQQQKGKQWILTNGTTDRHREVLLMYLLLRTKDPSTTSEMRLHMLYLINDWAHHCARKKLQAITQMLDRYIAQLYSFSWVMAGDDPSKDKLKKLMTLWTTNRYFGDNVYKMLGDPVAVVATSRATALAQYQQVANEVIERVQHNYKQYETQHIEYSRHVQQNIAALKAQNVMQQHSAASQQSKRRSRFDQTPQEAQAPPFTQPPPRFPGPTPSQTMFGGGAPPFPPPGFPPPNRMPPRAPWGPGTSGPPPMAAPPPIGPPTPLMEATLRPTVMYYDLPAGLMVPLVKLEDTDYAPINPDNLRLPPPLPPSEKLINSVEMFFAPPNHERPRDSEGWERLGLYEYFKAKGDAAHQRGKKLGRAKSSESDSRSGSGSSSSGSRSPSPRSRRQKREKTPPQAMEEPNRSSMAGFHEGLGASGDEFDEFRRMKAGHFVDRMNRTQQERAEKKEHWE